jgi:TATA-binding protein-associated factor Taf7
MIASKRSDKSKIKSVPKVTRQVLKAHSKAKSVQIKKVPEKKEEKVKSKEFTKNEKAVPGSGPHILKKVQTAEGWKRQMLKQRKEV